MSDKEFHAVFLEEMAEISDQIQTLVEQQRPISDRIMRGEASPEDLDENAFLEQSIARLRRARDQAAALFGPMKDDHGNE